MTNAFSPNYVPQIKMDDVQRDAKISATRTRQRKEAMASADEEIAKQAKGDIGKLSKRGKRRTTK